MGYYWLLLVFVCTIYKTQAANVLVVAMQSFSHALYLNNVGAGLAQKGHHVFTVTGTHFPQSKLKIFSKMGLEFITYKCPRGVMTLSSEEYEKRLIDSALTGVGDPTSEGIFSQDCEWMLQDKEFMARLKNIGFDIAVVDSFLLGPCGLLLPHLLDIPFVSVSSAINLFEIGVPALPSFVPFGLSLVSDKMNFKERLINFLTIVALPWTLPVLFPSVTNYTLLHKYAKDPSLKTWNHLIFESELFMMTRSEILEWPIPTMPNLIILECITCSPGKALTGEAHTIVNSPIQDMVIVSFGSVAQFLPDEVTQTLFKAFSVRQELIVWKVPKDVKYALEKLENLPENLKLMTWLPQNDLLAHPKAKLFITHCGNNGQYESLYHGVPMVGLPIFAEQHHNCFRMSDHGYGECLDIKTFSIEELGETMDTVLNNQKYKNNANKASEIMQNRPMNARQLAAYWIEHVMEFGSGHLRSHGMELPWYSYWMLDIFLCLLIMAFVLVYCLVTLLKLLYRVCYKTEPHKFKCN